MWTGIRAAIFVLSTILLAYASRASLTRPRTHGFYRFFVFETILAIALINAPVWLRDPFSWNQLISWVLLVCSVIVVVLGVRALHVHGRPDASARSESGLIGFEHTSRLVRENIFRYIRHPMYSSLLLLAWGIFFKAPGVVVGALAVFATATLMVMARVEEAECTRVFGQEYREYMRRTKRFIPFIA